MDTKHGHVITVCVPGKARCYNSSTLSSYVNFLQNNIFIYWFDPIFSHGRIVLSSGDHLCYPPQS